MAVISHVQRMAGGAQPTGAEKLALAVLLFFRASPFSADDREMWEYLTGTSECTTKVLCDLARKVQAAEQAR